MSPRKLEQAVGGDSRRETGGHLQGHVAGEPLDAATGRTVASWRVNKWASAGCKTAESPTPRISMPGTTWPWIPGLLWGQDPRGLLGWLAPALDLRVKPFLMQRALAGRGWITAVEQTHRDLRRGKPACPGTVGASPPVLRGFRVTARVRVSSWLCWMCVQSQHRTSWVSEGSALPRRLGRWAPRLGSKVAMELWPRGSVR